MNRIRILVPRGCSGDQSAAPVDMWVSAARHALPTFITVTGEIDASNVEQLHAGLREAIRRGGAFVVDLRRVEFLSVAGYRELLTVSEECSQAGLDWALVSSGAVNLLSRATVRVGTDPVLPLASSRDEAVRRLIRPERPPLVVRPDRTRC